MTRSNDVINIVIGTQMIVQETQANANERKHANDKRKILLALLTRTGLCSLLHSSLAARLSRWISSEALHDAESIVHVKNLPVGSNV